MTATFVENALPATMTATLPADDVAGRVPELQSETAQMPAVSVIGIPDMIEPELADMPDLQSDDGATPAQERPDANRGAIGGTVRNDITSHGYVPFYRNLRNAWWFEHKPWSYGHLFLWLLLDANFKPAMREYDGSVITVPRGGVLTSVLSLSNQSGLSRSSVRRFIRKMTESGEIRTLKSGTQGIVLQLLRYDEYAVVNNGRYNGRTTTEQ